MEGPEPREQVGLSSPGPVRFVGPMALTHYVLPDFSRDPCLLSASFLCFSRMKQRCCDPSTSLELSIFYPVIEGLSGRKKDTCSPFSFPGVGQVWAISPGL